MKWSIGFAALITLVASTALVAAPNSEGDEGAVDTESGYTDTYDLRMCEFVDQGENPYLILMPGFQLVLQGPENGKHEVLVITVTEKTRKIHIPNYGWVSTRVIEEKEWLDGIPKETARTFMAIDKKTMNVYDFGDETDIYDELGVEVVSHEGGWMAGQPDDDGIAMPGIFMPGTFLLGARYYQQLADGYSSERAENVGMGLTYETPAGVFKNCIKVRETNWEEPKGAETFKLHAPGVGLLGEDALRLTAFGYDIFDVNTGKMKGKETIHIAPIEPDEEVAEEPKPVRKISDEKAKEIALKTVPGEVIGIALERKLGGLRIVVEVIAKKDGVETDVIIDMETGEVLGTET